jgi:hypothetical protein
VWRAVEQSGWPVSPRLARANGPRRFFQLFGQVHEIHACSSSKPKWISAKRGKHDLEISKNR